MTAHSPSLSFGAYVGGVPISTQSAILGSSISDHCMRVHTDAYDSRLHSAKKCVIIESNSAPNELVAVP